MRVGAGTIVGLGVGLVAGFLWRGLLDRPPGPPDDSTAGQDAKVGAAPELLPMLESRLTPVRDGSSRSPDAPSSTPSANGTRASETEETQLPSLAASWIDVSVFAGEGTPSSWSAVGGTAYALPAGAPGVEKAEEIPHTWIPPGGTGKIPVAFEGTYDVGYAIGCVGLLQRDVRVGKEGARVRLDLPRLAPIRFQLASGLPAPDGLTKFSLRAWVSRASTSASRSFPGRGDQLRFAGVEANFAETAGTDGETIPLTAADRWRVFGFLQEETTDGDEVAQDASRRWELVPSATEARGGDTVTLSLRAMGSLVLTVKASIATWDEPPTSLRVHLRRPGGEDWQPHTATFTDRTDAEARLRERILVGVPAGRWELSWDGDGVAEGLGGAFEMSSGGTVERTVELQPVPHATTEPNTEPLGARMPIEATPDPRADRLWRAIGLWRDGSPFLMDVPLSAPATLRSARGFLAIGTEWVSAPETLPESGPWRPRLERAGFVVYAPEVVPDDALGTVVARRTDGFLVPWIHRRGPEYRTEVDWASEVRLEPGTRLGPFVPGALDLEILIGRQKTGDVHVTIRPGGIETMRLPSFAPR